MKLLATITGAALLVSCTAPTADRGEPSSTDHGGSNGSQQQVAQTNAGWRMECKANKHCRVYTIAEVRFFQDAPATLLVLEFSLDGEVLISALDTQEQHDKFYSRTGPVELIHEGQKYVPSGFFFSKNFGADLLVDTKQQSALKQFRFSFVDDSHLMASAGTTGDLIKAFKQGRISTLVYKSLFGTQRATFSLEGFEAAIRNYSGVQEQQTSPNKTEPTAVISKLLVGNRFGIGADDPLRSIDNPKGSGTFVFVPRQRFFGVRRLFIWFVKGDTAVKLNGATDDLTPGLRWPREVSFKFWRNTGLSADNVTELGLKLAFGK